MSDAPTAEQFRAIGQSADSINFPRSPSQIKMFAAWLGTTPDIMPEAMKYFANANTKAAWERAEAALCQYYGVPIKSLAQQYCETLGWLSPSYETTGTTEILNVFFRHSSGQSSTFSRADSVDHAWDLLFTVI
jgi:hypothetical protein